MKNKLLSMLAVAGIFGATSANAYTVTVAEVQTYGNNVASYLTADYAANPSFYTQYGITAADIQNFSSLYTQLATYPASTISPIVATYNSVLQTPGCLGMGTAATGINQTNLQACVDGMTSTLTSAGYTGPSAMAGGVIAIYAAAGLPISVGGASVPLSGAAPISVISCCSSTAEVVSKVIMPQIQRATSIQQATIISNVVSNIFSTRASVRPGAQIRMSLGAEKGMAAGNSPAKLNAWFNASDSQIGNSAAATNFGGNVNNALAGLDYMFSSQLVAGVSLGYDRVSIDYNFLANNSGLTSTGWMLAPYASYQVNDIVSVDGAIGYAEGDADTRNAGVTTTQGYTRSFAALNLNGNYWKGDWQLTAKANYIHAEEKTGTTNRMEQLRLGGQVGYWTEGVMPYASLTYVNDLSASGAIASADKEAWVAGIGVNLFSKGALSGGLSYTHEFERKDSKNDTIMANIGYRF